MPTGDSVPPSLREVARPPHNAGEFNPWRLSLKALTFDLSDMPRPVPFFGPILGYTEFRKRFRINNNWHTGELVVGRPLTETEERRLAYHILDIEAKMSYASFLGAAFGAYRGWKGHQFFTYPMYRPIIGSVDPNKFLFFRGSLANILRHTWRYTVYCFLGHFALSTAASFVIIPMSQKKARADPELAEFNEHMAARREEQWQSRGTRHRPWGLPKEPSDENYPPIIGLNFESHLLYQEQLRVRAKKQLQQQREEKERQEREAREKEEEERRLREQQGQSSWAFWSRKSSSNGDDDASPTGGMFEHDVNQGSKDSNGSAWDRLRRGEAPQPQPQAVPKRPLHRTPYRQPGQPRPQGEPLEWREPHEVFEEEQAREREQAQKEFDEMIERERKAAEAESKDNKKNWW
jgi:hypothetical protein